VAKEAGLAPSVALIDCCAGLKEELHALWAVGFQQRSQRVLQYEVWLVWGGSVLEQCSDGFAVATCGGPVEWHPPVSIGLTDQCVMQENFLLQVNV
jgi:hypothetical protein